MLTDVLITIYIVLLAFTTFYAVYYAFLGVIGLFMRKQKYPIVEDKLKFCLFVPCHNEQDVIAATIENYVKLQYNPELFDIYFIADNCTDETAKRAREAIEKYGMKNFYVMERNVDDPMKKGKPHALNWGIQTLEAGDGFYKKYDLFMIFDADNFTDSDILRHVNSQYLSIKEEKRPALIQTYLDSKNKDNMIARGYYVAYRFTNGFFQLPRYKLGLVPGIGGTGFAITTEFLNEIGGFHCTSLVEDMEIQTIATLKGRRIAYNHNVRIYDEKPTGIKASAVQKTRWSQGHWFVFFKFGWRLILKMFNPKEIKFFFKRFDCLIYLSSILLLFASGLTLLYSIGLLIAGIRPDIVYLPTIILSVFSTLLLPISSLLDGKKREKKRVLIDLIPNLIPTWIHSVIYYYACIVGLLKCRNQKVWKKTQHKVTSMESTGVELEEVEAPVETVEESAPKAAEILQEIAATENEAEKSNYGQN